LTETSDSLIKRIRALEEQLEAELDRRREAFQYDMSRRRVIFEDAVIRQQKAFKRLLWGYICGARPMVIVTAPVIYSVIIPFVLLDLFMTVYQAICFPVYGISKVRRGDYIIFDRRHLAYLNGIEKLNCVYCSYGNGLLAYAREIAARTERHWCPIKHAKRMAGSHLHYAGFVEYGDAKAYREIVAGPPSASTVPPLGNG
jgi:hypothetical protein